MNDGDFYVQLTQTGKMIRNLELNDLLGKIIKIVGDGSRALHTK